MAFPSMEHRRYFENMSDYFCPYTKIQLGPVGLDPSDFHYIDKNR